MGTEASTTSTTEDPAANTGGGASPSTDPNLTPRPDIVDANTVLNQQAGPPVVEDPPAAPVADPPEEPAAVAPGGETLDQKALAARLHREREKNLKEAYGTADSEEIKKIKANREAEKKRLERLEKLEQARKRSRQTESERLAADAQAKADRIKELETEVRTYKEDRVAAEQDAVINDTAGKYIRPERLRYARRDLADHIKGLDKEKLSKFGPRQLDKFFADLAKNDADFAIPAASEEVEPPPAAPVPPKPRVRQKAITTGKGGVKKQPAAPPDGSGMMNGKTVKPGQPNSMNAGELREYYSKRNMKKPY